MYYKKFITYGVMMVCLIGCTASLYMPTANDAEVFKTKLETLKSGREMYINKCGSCHNLYLPEKYTNQEWIQILNRMQKPAKIDDSQKELIMKYIETTARK